VRIADMSRMAVEVKAEAKVEAKVEVKAKVNPTSVRDSAFW